MISLIKDLKHRFKPYSVGQTQTNRQDEHLFYSSRPSQTRLKSGVDGDYHVQFSEGFSICRDS
jgi:hypothetical protein